MKELTLLADRRKFDVFLWNGVWPTLETKKRQQLYDTGNSSVKGNSILMCYPSNCV